MPPARYQIAVGDIDLPPKAVPILTGRGIRAGYFSPDGLALPSSWMRVTVRDTLYGVPYSFFAGIYGSNPTGAPQLFFSFLFFLSLLFSCSCDSDFTRLILLNTKTSSLAMIDITGDSTTPSEISKRAQGKIPDPRGEVHMQRLSDRPPARLSKARSSCWPSRWQISSRPTPPGNLRLFLPLIGL